MGEDQKQKSAVASAELRSVTPDLPKRILAKLSAFIEVKREDGAEKLASALRRLQDLWQDEPWSLELRAVALVLADLIDQGWEVTADDVAIHLLPPGLRLAGESAEKAKERLRRALQTSRDRQLGEVLASGGSWTGCTELCRAQSGGRRSPT